MNEYILVSLWADDDDATRNSHQFALRLHEHRAARGFLHGEAPSQEDLRRAADACPEAAVVLFAHGGPTLSARQQGDAWINAQGLAAILSGRRVYAFACSTFAPRDVLAWSTFADLAVDACIHVFVGHAVPVMTPLANVTGARHDMYGVIESFIESFLDGEDEEAMLVDIGKRHVDWDVPLEIDLPSEDPHHEGAFGWSSAAFLKGFFENLKVKRKPAGAASASAG